METPENLKYTEEHEWVRADGKTAVVGITDYAQGELGDIVFVELPQAGAALQQGGVFGTIEAVKTVSDLYAPVSGKVVAVNEALGNEPEAVNQAPYEAGWMIKIEMENAGELEALMDAASYRNHVGEGH
jgi:glycine cleavage system H protein